MRAKKEYSIKAEAHLKSFTTSFTALKKQLKKIDARLNPLQSHKIHQAIFALPYIKVFGEEEQIGHLHFNDYLDLVALAKGTNQQQSDHYFTLAFEQLTMAQSYYDRAKLSSATLADYTAVINQEKSAFTTPVIENVEFLEPTDESLQSDDQSLESDDESLQSVDEPLPVEQKKRVNSIAENNTTFFYVDTVPLKKRQKFENDTLSVIRKIKEESDVESSAVSMIGI